MGGELLSSIGTGTTVPFLLVYLDEVCRTPDGVVGLLLVARALVALAGATLGGVLCDRIGPKAVVVAALAVTAVCSVGMATSASPLPGGAAMLAHTVAFTVLAPALDAMLAQAAPGPARQAAFAWRNTAVNLGGALGAAAASVTLVVLGTGSGLTMLYVLDALSFAGFALLLALRVTSFARPAAPQGKEPPGPGLWGRAAGTPRRWQTRSCVGYAFWWASLSPPGSPSFRSASPPWLLPTARRPHWAGCSPRSWSPARSCRSPSSDDCQEGAGPVSWLRRSRAWPSPGPSSPSPTTPRR